MSLRNAAVGAFAGAVVGGVCGFVFTQEARGVDDRVVDENDPNVKIVGKYAVSDPELRDLLLELANARSASPETFKRIVSEFNDLVALEALVSAQKPSPLHMLKGSRIAKLTRGALAEFTTKLKDTNHIAGFNDLESKLDAVLSERLQNIVADVSLKM